MLCVKPSEITLNTYVYTNLNTAYLGLEKLNLVRCIKSYDHWSKQINKKYLFNVSYEMKIASEGDPNK